MAVRPAVEPHHGAELHPLPLEGVPEDPLLARLAARAARLPLDEEGAVAELQGASEQHLPHGKARDALLGEVQIAALPLRADAVGEPLVEEDLVGGGRAAHLLGLDALAVLGQAERRTRGEAARTVEDAGRHLHVEALVLVAQVLALGVVRRREVGAQADHPPLPHGDGHAPRQVVALTDFAPGGELHQVDGIIARADEHRARHVAPVEVVVAEAAEEGDALEVAHRARCGARLPAVVRARAVDQRPRLVPDTESGHRAAHRVAPHAGGVDPREPGAVALEIPVAHLGPGRRQGREEEQQKKQRKRSHGSSRSDWVARS